jgi:hypothetical protein
MRTIIIAAAIALAAPAQAETIMHAIGTFSVKMTPVSQNSVDGVAMAQMQVSKAFTGGMVAMGEGDMLTAAGAVPESAAYVLIERVTGTVAGKAGSFALMHHATMNRGVPDQHISIVPDSGSGALTGISGSLSMRIEAGVHHYDLAYALPGQ